MQLSSQANSQQAQDDVFWSFRSGHAVPTPKQLQCLSDLKGVKPADYVGKVLRFGFVNSPREKELYYVQDLSRGHSGPILTLQQLIKEGEFTILDCEDTVPLKSVVAAPAGVEHHIDVYDQKEVAEYLRKRADGNGCLSSGCLRLLAPIAIASAAFIAYCASSNETKKDASRGLNDVRKNPGGVTREFLEDAKSTTDELPAAATELIRKFVSGGIRKFRHEILPVLRESGWLEPDATQKK